MAYFYTWPRVVTYIITITFALCVLLQTLATVISFHRYPRNRTQVLETLLELSVLFQIFACSLLHGQAVLGYADNIIAPTGYGTLRIVIYIMIVLLSIAVIISSRNLKPLFIIAAASLTLPVSERLTGNIFAYLYIAAIFFWLIRSVFVGLSRYRENNKSLSSLSIKSAIYSMNTGIMFCEHDGYTLLSNEQMQRLMLAITGKVQRNGKIFFSLLTLGDINPECRITWFEEQNVCLLPDGSAWIFNLTELLIKRKKYIQLTATDISERWKLTAELQPQSEELQRRQKELSEAIKNLHILSREKETQRAKMRAHDILGERLTIMLRTVRSEQEPDYVLLRNLSQGLIDELRAVGSAPSPQDELDILKQTFEAIGVEILFSGKLPEDSGKGSLFADIAREAVTNAVRHGLATQVYIHMDDSDGDYHLRITDNGHPPLENITEGGGLSGMRKKVEPFKGTVTITVSPRFILTVYLPGGEQNK